MNYFEHHIGDYDQATAHLSAVEDGIYSRMIRWYMADEKPLPADVLAITRRVRAHSRDEKAAVKTVLAEFFELRVDGYHQSRCDAEIAKYQETEPEREARRENDRERQRRARERRKALFEQLREFGIVPPFDTKTADLESALSRAQKRDTSRDVTPPVTRDNTATHTPDTIPNTSEAIASSERRRGSRLASDWHPGQVGIAFGATLGLSAGQIASELDKFRDFWASKAGKDGAKLDWQATWRNWLRSAAERMPRGQQQPESFRQRDEREAAEKVAFLTGRKPAITSPPQGDFIDAEVTDVTPRRLG